MQKKSDSNSTIAVLGAGSWGTALAIHLARNGQDVRIWSPEVKQIDEINTHHTNSYYLPGIDLPKNIVAFHDLAKTLEDIHDVLIVVPSHAFRSTLLDMKPLIKKNTRIAWATKGLDPETNQLLHEVVEEILGDHAIAVLSGPSFAKEVAMDLPTAVTIASPSRIFANDLFKRFHSNHFRVYTSSDVIGVELGGAMKNVIAIAVGIADGLNFGMNSRAALITRGLAETVRLGIAMGGRPETFMGLSGIGDLVLTCSDNQSRNRRFGLALGQGKSLEETKKEIGQVIEGIGTAALIHKLAKKKHVETPICEQVYKVLYENLSAQVAGNDLLMRDAKKEETF